MSATSSLRMKVMIEVVASVTVMTVRKLKNRLSPEEMVGSEERNMMFLRMNA